MFPLHYNLVYAVPMLSYTLQWRPLHQTRAACIAQQGLCVWISVFHLEHPVPHLPCLTSIPFPCFASESHDSVFFSSVTRMPIQEPKCLLLLSDGAFFSRIFQFSVFISSFQAVLYHFNMPPHHSSYPIPPHLSITLPSFIFFLTFVILLFLCLFIAFHSSCQFSHFF